MEIDILHAAHGDKKRKIDTSTEKGRQEAAVLLNKMFKQGVAVFLERPTTKYGASKTYRVRRYDPEKDLLIIEADVKGKQKELKTRGKKAKATAVAPVAGGSR
jgi:hypothetical protein